MRLVGSEIWFIFLGGLGYVVSVASMEILGFESFEIYLLALLVLHRMQQPRLLSPHTAIVFIASLFHSILIGFVPAFFHSDSMSLAGLEVAKMCLLYVFFWLCIDEREAAPCVFLLMGYLCGRAVHGTLAMLFLSATPTEVKWLIPALFAVLPLFVLWPMLGRVTRVLLIAVAVSAVYLGFYARFRLSIGGGAIVVALALVATRLRWSRYLYACLLLLPVVLSVVAVGISSYVVENRVLWVFYLDTASNIERTRAFAFIGDTIVVSPWWGLGLTHHPLFESFAYSFGTDGLSGVADSYHNWYADIFVRSGIWATLGFVFLLIWWFLKVAPAADGLGRTEKFGAAAALIGAAIVLAFTPFSDSGRLDFVLFFSIMSLVRASTRVTSREYSRPRNAEWIGWQGQH